MRYNRDYIYIPSCKIFNIESLFLNFFVVILQGSKEDKLSRQSSSGHGSSTVNTAANSPTEDPKKTLEDTIDITKRDLITVDKLEKEINEPSKLEQILNSDKQEEHAPCACWCQGWAEIYVRRPTGDMSWIMRIQNTMPFETNIDFPAHAMTSLYMPTTSESQSQASKYQELSAEFSEGEIEVELIQ